MSRQALIAGLCQGQCFFFRFGAINFLVLSGNTGAVASIYSVPS